MRTLSTKISSKVFNAVFIVLIFVFCGGSAQSQVLSKLLKQTTTAKPSDQEISLGIKEALQQGVIKSTDLLSAENGFFGDAAIKIFFPPEAKKAENTLRGLGLNKLCDNVILSLNRAAEDAAKQAKPIFVNAIRQMSIQDASNILLGANDAATQYFKAKTTDSLSQKFKPVIDNSLEKTGAKQYYTQAASAYNKIPFSRNKIDTDIVNYVTQKAISGLFTEVALQELKIRSNFASQPTALLQKVFGYAAKAK